MSDKTENVLGVQFLPKINNHSNYVLLLEFHFRVICRGKKFANKSSICFAVDLPLRVI